MNSLSEDGWTDNVSIAIGFRWYFGYETVKSTKPHIDLNLAIYEYTYLSEYFKSFSSKRI